MYFLLPSLQIHAYIQREIQQDYLMLNINGSPKKQNRVRRNNGRIPQKYLASFYLKNDIVVIRLANNKKALNIYFFYTELEFNKPKVSD